VRRRGQPGPQRERPKRPFSAIERRKFTRKQGSSTVWGVPDRGHTVQRGPRTRGRRAVGEIPTLPNPEAPRAPCNCDPTTQHRAMSKVSPLYVAQRTWDSPHAAPGTPHGLPHSARPRSQEPSRDCADTLFCPKPHDRRQGDARMPVPSAHPQVSPSPPRSHRASDREPSLVFL
jgi:hypothetical protein